MSEIIGAPMNGDILGHEDIGEGQALLEWGAYRKKWTGTAFSDDLDVRIFGQRIVAAKPLDELKDSVTKYASYSDAFRDWRSEHPNSWYPWEEDEDGFHGYRYLYRLIDQPNNEPHKDYLFCSILYPKEVEHGGSE